MIAMSFNVYSNQLNQKDFPQHYVETYDALKPDDHPLVGRTFDIFERVKNASDKTYNAPPNLVILKRGTVPPTVLKTGYVIISQSTLEKCYKGVGNSIGDARLAFIIGHELAHLANSDYWIDKTRSHLVSNSKVKKILKKNSRQDLQMELKADAYGIVFAAMAGFEPKALLQENGQIFFSNWSNQADSIHPSPKIRAEQLKHEMQMICDKIDLFHLGLRLYQMKKYADALPLLVAFQQTFPCREVSNLIGLIYYQQAIDALARFDSKKAYQFKLSIILDTDTRANRFRQNDRQEFTDCLKNAIWHFKMACDKDLQYLPARINLSAALILNGEIHGAMNILKQAMQMNNNDPLILNNKAVAMYLLGNEINVDMFQQSVDLFQKLIQLKPDFSDPYYNLGQIMNMRERMHSSHKYFKQYLEIQPYGNYSKLACQILKQTYHKPEQDQCSRKILSGVSIFPGELNHTIKEKIDALHLVSHVLPMGVYSGNYYKGNGYYILVLEGTIELVEMPVPSTIDYPTQCVPLKSHHNLSTGTRTFVFDRWAVDILKKKIVKIIL
jgi:tetratricopeptide (TPR) repeat protein